MLEMECSKDGVVSSRDWVDFSEEEALSAGVFLLTDVDESFDLGILVLSSFDNPLTYISNKFQKCTLNAFMI